MLWSRQPFRCVAREDDQLGQLGAFGPFSAEEVDSMHIVFVCREFSPYVETSLLAKETVHLAKALIQNDHQVSAVIPGMQGVNPTAHSLARRLTPLKALVDGLEFSAIRFDGRTPDGVAINLLDISGPGGAEVKAENEHAAACAHGATFLCGLPEPPELCISLGPELSGVAEAARQHPELVETVFFADLRNAAEQDIRSVPFADRVIVSRQAANAVDNGNGSFVVIPKAAPADIVKDKLSAKTAFQMKFGLKVRSDAPLTTFHDFTKELLAQYLAADVQAVIPDDRDDCTALKERYPDRLVALPRAEFGAALHASDGCVTAADVAMAQACLTVGVLPIVTAAVADDVVDIEASLDSGTGIVMRSVEPSDAAVGMSRWIAAFHKRDAFRALQKRLPEYAVTWNRAAALIENLVEEVRMENR